MWTSARRASAREARRAARPRDTRRLTTTETELGSVAVSSASWAMEGAASERAAPSASCWRTKSWAPLTPSAFSAAREERRIARTMRRMAFIAAWISPSAPSPAASVPDPPTGPFASGVAISRPGAAWR